MKLNKVVRLAFTGLAAITIIASTSNTTQAQEKEKIDFHYTSYCKTRSTRWDGKRYDCWSAWSTHTVPSNYVYNTNSLKTGYRSRKGSKNSCNIQWHDYVEIVPGTGIKAPRTIKIQSYALSSKGTGSGPGWSDCFYKGQYVKFK